MWWSYAYLLLSVESLAQEWVTFGANEYFYESDLNDNVGYYGATEICNDHNATLAIITSEEQNQFIAHSLTGNTGEPQARITLNLQLGHHFLEILSTGQSIILNKV